MELNEILSIGLKSGASDIHLKAGLPPMSTDFAQHSATRAVDAKADTWINGESAGRPVRGSMRW